MMRRLLWTGRRNRSGWRNNALFTFHGPNLGRRSGHGVAMTLRAFSALAALSAAIVLAGWVAIGAASVTTGDTIEAVDPAQARAPAVPAPAQISERPRPAPVAAAAVVDSLMLTPAAFAPLQ